MITIRFLFLKFVLERGGGNASVSSDDGITTGFSLTLGHDDWGTVEGRWEIDGNPIGVHWIVGSNNDLLSAS